MTRRLDVLLPASVDDPALPSGGNRYDRRLADGLAARGWVVHEHLVPGRWPWPDEVAHRALRRALAEVPDDGLTLVDGLLASTAPELLVPASRRFRLVVLVHMAVGGRPAAARAEAAVLASAARTVTTSEWLRRRLLADYGLDPQRVRAALPGVDAVPPGAGRSNPAAGAGGALLCVASVTPGKGLDVLATALARVADLGWHCSCVGSLTRAPGFVADLQRVLAAWGLAERVALRGPLAGSALQAAWDAADLLVLPSRAESFGMVVPEALARGLPVLASDVGGVPEALGITPDGRRAGLLVPPGDPTALARALRRWLGDAALRTDLRLAARDRAGGLVSWSATTDTVEQVLDELEVAA